MSWALLALLLGALIPLAASPLLARRRMPWPAEPPDERDDLARAASSIRDLDLALAAGTLAADDHRRLRALIERSAFAPQPSARPRPIPVRTFALASLVAGIIAVVIAASLPRELGDRAPGQVLTGGGGERITPTTEEIEANARAAPRDIPIRLALADAYLGQGRVREAVTVYQEVLAQEPDNVPALNALGLVLLQNGEARGALLAVDRVLALRPRDQDALFLKGLALYREERYAEAVPAWTAYLEAGEFHSAAAMVRPLLEEARRRAGGP